MLAKPKKDNRSYRLIVCVRCGLERVTKITGRDICAGCYRKEPSSNCIKCGVLRHFVDPQTGLCPRCSGKRIPDKTGASFELPSQIECEKCGRTRARQFRNLNLCGQCYKKEEVFRCKRCDRPSHLATEQTQMCPPCTVIVNRPVGVCAKCSKKEALYDETDRLCYRCHELKKQLLRKRASRVKGTCSGCGKFCYSQLLSRHVCNTCLLKEKADIKTCNGCGKDKLFHNKKHNLCKRCYHNKLAPKLLREFISGFVSSSAYNNSLFRLLANNIDWKQVTDDRYVGFRWFGEFLQRWEFKQPVSWDQIEASKSELRLGNKKRAKRISELLSDLGDLLAAQGKLESFTEYTSKRSAFNAIKAAPEQTHALLRRYAFWLKEHGRRWPTIKKHMRELSSFWHWCWPQNIKSPGAVQPLHVKEFFLTQHQQWRCTACERKTVLDSFDSNISKDCTDCGSIKSVVYMEPTAFYLWSLRSYLKVFFDWARIERFAIINPVQIKVGRPPKIIQHYSPEVIQQLFNYITSPETDPLEAIVLYLIIAYGFSNWELQHVQLQSFFDLRNGKRFLPLAEVYGVVLPKPSPSIGNRTPGRPDTFLKFRPKDASWLKPLLERLEQDRNKVLKGGSSRYLIVTRETARIENPASKKTVYRIVRRGSRNATGAACNPRTLRKTVGIIFTDKNGSSVLTWMGWSDSQIPKYDSATRKEIQPRSDLKEA